MEKRNQSGQFVESATLEDVLEVFDAVDGPPVVTSADVADATGVSRDTARRKLDELEEREEVDSRRSAGRVLYWRVADVRGDPGPRALQEPAQNDIAASDSSVGRDVDADHAGDQGAETASPSVDREEPTVETDPAFVEVEFPSGRDRGECIEAVLAARDHLRENGPASMRELVAEVMPDHPLGYNLPEIEDGDLVTDRYRGAWWRKVVRPGLKACEDVQPATGGGDYRYIGEEDR